METVMLEAAITKIGHLLALGFGEAGSAIISKNMTGEGELNPMVEGQRTYAVFGFCDIRHFAENTEVLQTRIMTFVNQIAEIAHSQVDKYGGAANKNLGEAFLMMWKFHDPQEFKSRKPI
jgi:class 3 adenylate cyclase